MTDILVDSAENVTLVGGAPAAPALLRHAVALAPRVVAADGGVGQAVAHGLDPVAVIGDMDSLPSDQTWRNSDMYIYPLREQDTTDFEKCLYSVRAPLILGCGFLGARIDHGLAALNALVRYRDKAVVLLGEGDLVFHCPPLLTLDLPKATPVSFFPLQPTVGIASKGLRWPITGLDFAPGGRIGTSNLAVGGTVEAAFDEPGMLVTLPVGHLDAVARLLSTPAR